MLIDITAVTIPTWTERATLAYLSEIAATAQFAVESGTYFGASAKAILSESECHLWCVDKFMVFGSKEVTELFLAPWILKGQCEIIRGDSERAAEKLAHMRGKLDWSWVDDGHSEEDLRRDIRCLLPLIKPGGLLLGHDWDGNNDVARGVLSMIPKEQLTFPVPRVWQFQKP